MLPFAAILCLVTQSCLAVATPRAVARQAPLSMGFSRQARWSGLPVPPPGESRPRDGASISWASCTAGWLFTHQPPILFTIVSSGLLWYFLCFHSCSPVSILNQQPEKNLYKTSFQLILRTVRIKWKLFTRTGGLPNMALSCHSAVISNNIPLVHSTPHTLALFSTNMPSSGLPQDFPILSPVSGTPHSRFLMESVYLHYSDRSDHRCVIPPTSHNSPIPAPHLVSLPLLSSFLLKAYCLFTIPLFIAFLLECKHFRIRIFFYLLCVS